MKNHYLGLRSHMILKVCIVMLSGFSAMAQLQQNVNKLLGLSITGTTCAGNSDDWILSAKASGAYVYGTGYVIDKSNGKQYVNLIKIDTSGTVQYELRYDCLAGVGFDLHVTSVGVFIIGRANFSGTYNMPYGPGSSFFSIKINTATGAIDPTYGIKMYNDYTINLPAPQNGLSNTIVGEFSEGKPHSCVILDASGNFDGFMLCGSYCDNSFPSNASLIGMPTGIFLLKLDKSGNVDNSFGNYGVKTYFQNTSSLFYCPRVFNVCVNYNSTGNVVGYAVAGAINDSLAGVRLFPDVVLDGLVFMTDASGNKTSENVFDETSHFKTGTSLSFPYTDVTDNGLCTNIYASIAPAGFFGQENSNERATRIKQLSNGGDFIVVAQFDWTVYFVSGCASTSHQGQFISADPAILRIDSTCNVIWTANAYQSTGADFENDLICDGAGNILVMGSTMQEPNPGMPSLQQVVLTKINASTGFILSEGVYNDTSVSQTMFCPFSFCTYNGSGLFFAGDHESGTNADEYQFIKVSSY